MFNSSDKGCDKFVEAEENSELYSSLLAQNLTCLNGLPVCPYMDLIFSETVIPYLFVYKKKIEILNK